MIKAMRIHKPITQFNSHQQAIDNVKTKNVIKLKTAMRGDRLIYRSDRRDEEEELGQTSEADWWEDFSSGCIFIFIF